MESSQLFYPYRALGLITDSTPFHIRISGKEYYLTTSIGNSFQIFSGSKLRLKIVSEQQPLKIKSIASYKQIVYTTCGESIIIWQRGKKIGALENLGAKIILLETFGKLLLSATEKGKIQLWEIDTNSNKISKETSLKSEIQIEKLTITTIQHPETYLNKILVGSKEGKIELWNINTKIKLYEFPGWNSEIKCISQSPVVDVIGVGLANGRIKIINIKYDILIAEFLQDEGEVSSLAFRSDGIPMLVSTTPDGKFVVWDLEKKKLLNIIKDCHSGKISKIFFLPREPILVSSGEDNSLKIWIFDQQDYSPRLLRSREGHYFPPHKIKFFQGSKHILSAGLDSSFRFFSTHQDHQNVEFSQKNIKIRAKKLQIQEELLKLPPIVDFDFSELKEKHWDNLITCQEKDKFVHIWRTDNKVLVKNRKLKSSYPVKSVAVSKCGNFAAIGDEMGVIQLFNLQSGLLRGNLGNENNAHQKEITGICFDSVNHFIITTSLDGKLKIWDFSERKLHKEYDIKSPITKLKFHYGNGLFAISSNDFVIRVYDLDTFKLARRFSEHSHFITDFTFSHDCHWLISTTADTIVRIFDLPSSKLIDWFYVDKPITSLDFSPSGDFLATTHADSLGIYLWANKNHFSSVLLHQIPEKPIKLGLPKLIDFQNPKNNDLDDSDDTLLDSNIPSNSILNNTQNLNLNQVDFPDNQISQELITLSLTPSTHWKNLSKIDIIKERNKPIEPPKKPETVPFFLKTEPGFQPVFVDPFQKNEEDEKNKQDSKKPLKFTSKIIVGLNQNQQKTQVIQILEDCELSSKMKNLVSYDYLPAIEYLQKRSPSAVDLELRSFNLFDDYQELKLFMRFILSELQTNRNFELLQAYLDLFLKIYGNLIIQEPELAKLAKQIQSIQKEKLESLLSLVQQNFCLISFFSGLK
ncbi:wd repeat-containing protein [Anaeramoeba ignava]|uniref:Wd repeat-containing protein n=1 Tax=Anaeramoeba ignava TaxID=1746090 RepID=A0A9Q0RBJ6_ANAIG|nr:wd repeat-containing protein [Anaeramoeba ignava]